MKTKRCASQRFRNAFAMLSESHFRKCVKSTGVCIGLDLPIPYVSIKRSKPVAKAGKFAWLKRSYLLFDLFDLTHGAIVPKRPDSGREFMDDHLFSVLDEEWKGWQTINARVKRRRARWIDMHGS